MSRRVLGLDRLAALVLGLVLVAVGLAVGAWGAHQVRRFWAGVPSALHTSAATTTYGQSWWPWATGAAAVVLVALGLWWLLAHIPRRATGPLRLDGSGPSGALSVDASSAADVAAGVLAESPGVRSASGRVITDRGQTLAELSVTAEPSVDLAELSGAIDAVSADLAAVLGRPDVRGRVAVRIARRTRATPARVSARQSLG